MSLTYADLIATAFNRHRRSIAFVQDGRQLSYAAAGDLVGRLMRALHDRGVAAGTGVAVLAPPRPEAWLAMAATHLLGARCTALHPLGSLEDHVFVCDDAEIDTLLVDMGMFGARGAELRDRAASLRQLLSIGPSSDAVDVLALAAGRPPAPLAPSVGERDPCWVLYTGGTTGRPKGVVLSHRAFATMALTALAEWEVPGEARYLAASPITHAAGTLVVPVLLRGGTVHLHSSFDPGHYLDTIARERITFCFGVPAMVYALLADPVLETTDTSSLRTFVYAASPMSPARLAEALERIGPVFLQFYGQTESTALGTVLWRRDHDPAVPGRLTSCGKPVASIRLQVQDDDGTQVAGGDVGEICLQGPSVMDGYWRQPQLTAETLRGGWLHTGDMAVRDDDGFLTIVDRKKDMVVSGGFNVFPREIEDVLSAHPAVAAAAVIGVPDDRWGEAVKAIVVLRPDADVSADELIAVVRERKGPVYAPKSVDFIDTIPLTPVGKTDKRALRAGHWAGQERLVH
jgi:acyl-CoA synthetase (AMP-forming)/AMP-acid ligase II